MGINKRNLAAGVKEMRSVAKRLLAWADDLEKSMAQEKEAPETLKDAAPVTTEQVKAFLTEKCAAGYGARVKALIASFGASTLSEVPAESLGELLDAAMLIGEEGEDEAHAG
ncbi:MAG: hypothetical protein ABTA22_04910 [Clostridia bacterium]|nr:hypothetical protein [Clostridia bacterium]